MNWEDTFQGWAKPPSQTEQTKCDNSEQAVRTAINKSSTLAKLNITVFPQGSYRNRTNVRLDSDVDICVLCTDVCFVDYSMAEGLTDVDVGLSDHPYTYQEFKNDVEKALRSYFGSNAIIRGNKAFNIHENSYRVDADVVPCFEHRRYHKRDDGSHYYYSGTELHPDNGGRVINWPQQNYDNGVSKNEATNRRFKAIVRILKRLRNKMEEENIVSVKPIPSYLIECLVWNVPNEGFNNLKYIDDVGWTLAHLYNETREFESCKEWGEINEFKYLFRGHQPWTLKQAHEFLAAAWDYLQFE